MSQDGSLKKKRNPTALHSVLSTFLNARMDSMWTHQ